MSCKHEETPNLSIDTLTPLASASGATFNGKINALGATGIKDAGFLYSETPNVTFDNSVKASAGVIANTGNFSVVNTDYFVPGKTFYVKAYAVSGDGNTIALGKEIQFTGQGGVGLPPTISDFTPKEGANGVVITITGKNFDTDLSHIKVSLGDKSLEVTESSLTLIKAKVADNTNINDLSGALTVMVREKTVSTAASFHLYNPPVVVDFNPKEGKIGTIVTLSGKFFDTDATNTTVTYKSLTLEVVQVSNTEIKARIPYQFDVPLKNYTGTITLGTRGQTLNTATTFHMTDTWKKLNDFPGNARYDAIGFSIGSSGFLGLGKKSGSGNLYTGDFWKYNPTNDSWSAVSSYATDGYYMNQSAIVLNGIAYVGIGNKTNTSDVASALSSFSQYSTGSNSWSASNWIAETGYYASSYSSVNGKGYVITGNGSNNKNLQFDGSSWTEKAPFPSDLRYKAITFTIGDKIYISSGAGSTFGSIFSSTWMYDTSNNTWTEKAAFPGTGRWQTTCFSINGYGFVVGGLTAASVYLKDVWMYNPTNNTWTQLTDFGGNEIIGGATFTIDGKVYIGTGASGSGVYKNDLWVF